MQNKFPHNWQWKSEARGKTLLILLAIAHFGRKESNKVNYTGTAVDLAKLTGLTPRTAQRAIKELVILGLVTKDSDNMSLSYNTFSVQPATICRSITKGSDNMSSGHFPPNDIYIDRDRDKVTIKSSNPLSIEAWEKDFNDFKYNNEKLTSQHVKFIKENFKNVNLNVEVQKFIDYWSKTTKPNTWSGYRRLLTWLGKAGKDTNERTNSRRFSKGRETAVSKEIDEETRRFADQQRLRRTQRTKGNLF